MTDLQEPSTSKGSKEDCSVQMIKSRIRAKTAKISEKLMSKRQQSGAGGDPGQFLNSESDISRNRNSSSSTAKTENHELQKKTRRLRNRRGDKNATNATATATKKTGLDTKVDVNSVDDLIVALLSLKPAKREEFLLQKAEERGLISFNKSTQRYQLNEKAANKDPEEKKSKSKAHSDPVNLWKFESWVNSIIQDGLSKEDKKKYFFQLENSDKNLADNEMYINSPEFISRLQKHAEKCARDELGEIIEGELRISNVNNYHAFVTNKESSEKKDAIICSKLARKFALNGDIVRCFVRNLAPPATDKTSDESDDSQEVSPKAFVIDIIRKVHDRKCIGLFSPKLQNDFAIFIPRDLKMPHIRIKKEDFPKEEENKIGELLYVAQIDYFTIEACYGKILYPVGKCGELESENKAILIQNHLTHESYGEKFNEMYSGALEITAEELLKREDIRKECVFTIDPLTAKDLDDAVSVKFLPNGNYEIGVHISDVSFFLEENSELDNIVKARTTSVYLVQEVFHMLPKPLCFKCSLLPGEDKYAFSVFWEMSKNAKILSKRFSKTVLNSCTQFAYEHAQKIIDNENQIFEISDFPKIENNWKVEDVVERIRVLNSLAEIMRKARFDNGAMSINRPKIYFDLDPKTGEPLGYQRYETNTANFLIEEFMLLANQTVARFIFDKYPNIAVLRNHSPPKDRLIMSCAKKLAANNIKLDTSTSKTIYTSMRRILEELSSAGKDLDSMNVAMSHIVSKTLKRATYICSDTIENEKQLWHYALSIPIYTHFTSPIRRYPDILVHRLLAAGLNYTPVPEATPEQLNSVLKTSNEMKYNAKIAGEHSTELYFLHFIKSKGSLVEKAVVIDAFQASCEVILITSGFKIQIPYARSHLKVFFGKEKNFTRNSGTYLATSKDSEEKIDISLLSVIEVVITVKKEKLYAEINAASQNKTESCGSKGPKTTLNEKIPKTKTPKSKLSAEKKALKKEAKLRKKNLLKEGGVQVQKGVEKLLFENVEVLAELVKNTAL